MGGSCRKLLEADSDDSLTEEPRRHVTFNSSGLDPQERYRWVLYMQEQPPNGEWKWICSSTQPKASKELAEMEGEAHLGAFHFKQRPTCGFRLSIERVPLWDNTTCKYLGKEACRSCETQTEQKTTEPGTSVKETEV